MTRDMSKIDRPPPTAAAVSAHIGQRWPVPSIEPDQLALLLAAAKVAAEAGELVDAVIKMIEGRADLGIEVLDEFGDVLVSSWCLAGRMGVDPSGVLAVRWAEVVER